MPADKPQANAVPKSSTGGAAQYNSEIQYHEGVPRGTALAYNRPLHTGLGDRLGVILEVVAFANVFNKVVYVFWFEKNPGSNAAYPLSDILQSTSLPHNLRLVDQSTFDLLASSDFFLGYIRYGEPDLLRPALAYDTVYTLAAQTMAMPPLPNVTSRVPNVTQTEFEASFRAIASEFQVHLPPGVSLPSQYIAVHVRTGDKPGWLLHEFNTDEVISSLRGRTALPVTVLCINASLQAHYEDQLRAVNLEVFRVETPSDRVAGSLFDFAVLLRSSAIIQHSTHAWSAFSSVAAMLRGIPLITTFVGANPNAPRHTPSLAFLWIFEKHLPDGKGKPPELMSSYQQAGIDQWLAKLPRRVTQ